MTRKPPIAAALGLVAVGFVLAGAWRFGIGPGVGDAATIELGQRIYAENCATCHGKKLEGQPDWKSPLPSGRMPAPPHDASGHTWHHPDGVLFRITKEGPALVVGNGYESDMEGFGSVLSDTDIRAVLAFIKSKWPERERQHQAQQGRGAMKALLIAAAVVLGMVGVAAAEPSAIPLHDTPQPLPELRFEDGEGEVVALARWRGKIVLLNVWATWCAPCRKEMPTLDRLQARLGGDSFEVVALSIDRAGPAVVRKFYQEMGITHLAPFVDQSGHALTDLQLFGLPVTILVSPEGLSGILCVRP
jgi:thiol-disulfide isomerase/thioredoxin/mono/diheme cytochrome c family protein